MANNGSAFGMQYLFNELYKKKKDINATTQIYNLLFIIDAQSYEKWVTVLTTWDIEICNNSMKHLAINLLIIHRIDKIV